MPFFSPGDRVVAINIDVSYPINPNGPLRYPITLPDGTLQKNTVYHVRGVEMLPGRNQGVYLTGLRAFYGKNEITFHYSRFRKVDLARDFVKKKKASKMPAASTAKTHMLPAP